MTTLTFVLTLLAMIVAIILIGRIFGSPKLARNLFLALSFGVIAGLAFTHKDDIRKSSDDNAKIEKVAIVSNESIQDLCNGVVTEPIITFNNLVGQIHIPTLVERAIKIPTNPYTVKITGGSPVPIDSS